MDKYITDIDLERFTRFLNIDRDVIFYEDDINTWNDIERLFSNTNSYFCVLFKKNPDPENEVGHWTCLIKFDDYKYEYFDCLGDPIPENILNAFIDGDIVDDVEVLNKALMARDGITCGKWVISRILAVPNSLEDYFNFFSMKKSKMTPDEQINFLFNFPT